MEVERQRVMMVIKKKKTENEGVMENVYEAGPVLEKIENIEKQLKNIYIK